MAPLPDAPARVRARRANARRSTGPRSATGRRRAALNARRHGLAVSISALPEYDPAIARLAGLIAGIGADRRRIGQARLVAEAQIDLLRIRRAKLMLLGRPTPHPSPGVGPARGRIATGRRTPAPDTGTVRGAVGEAEPDPAAIGETAREMLRLDRYERRALSRRNSAARALAAIGGGST